MPSVSNNSVRTVVIFGIIALILGAIVVGGIRLTRARNNSYETSHSSNVAQTNTAKQPAQPQQQKNTSMSTSQLGSSSTQKKTNQQSSNPAQPQTPVPAAPSPQPMSSSDGKTNATVSPQQNKLPGTSALSPSDFGLTMILMMLAVFFGNKLLRVRADYRRYIGL